MHFNDEPCQQNNFPAQFLSMPELDPEPVEANSAVELLAEFDIEPDMDQGIAEKVDDKSNVHNSLNCVLPSVSNDTIDDASLVEVIIIIACFRV